VVPASPWLDGVAPGTPVLTVNGASLRFAPAAGEAVRWWVVQYRSGGTWRTRTQFGTYDTFVVGSNVDRVRVYAGDRVMNLSGPAEWRRP
jgi:hypothetical protein